MTIEEAKTEVSRIAKRCGYEGRLTDGSLCECAGVYLEHCDKDGIPLPRVYMRTGHRPTGLNEIQWLLVRTPSFRRWFGKSVVVDGNGDPAVMYHGSWKDFDEFKPSSIVLSKVAMTLWSGPGFYFTDKEKVARIYAGGGDDRVYPVFLRLENPLMVDETGNAEGIGIDKSAAEKIFLAGDNTQWLDSGLASELARLDEIDGVKKGGKRYYRGLTRAERVKEYVSRLKTDVVKLKTAALAYGARSQRKLLDAVCRYSGYDGVIHTITPEVKEWVVYNPSAIKSAMENDGDFSENRNSVEDGEDDKSRHSLKKGSKDMLGFQSLVDTLSKMAGSRKVGMDIVDRNGRHHQPKAIPEGGQYEEEGQYLHGQAKVDAAIRHATTGKRASFLREQVAPLYAHLGHDSATRAKIQKMHEDIRGMGKNDLLKGLSRNIAEAKRHAAALEAVKDMDKEAFRQWLEQNPEYRTEMTDRLMNDRRYDRHYDVKGGFHDDGTGRQKHEAWEEAKWSVGAKAVASLILCQEYGDAVHGAPDQIMANMIARVQEETPAVENREETPSEQVVANGEGAQVQGGNGNGESTHRLLDNLTDDQIMELHNVMTTGPGGFAQVEDIQNLLNSRYGMNLDLSDITARDLDTLMLSHVDDRSVREEELERIRDVLSRYQSHTVGRIYSNYGAGSAAIEVSANRPGEQHVVSGLGAEDGNAMIARVRSALRSSGVRDRNSFSVNVRANGNVSDPRALDLPVALALAQANGDVNNRNLDEYAAIGELSSLGAVAGLQRSADDIRKAVSEARRIGRRGILVPSEMADVAAQGSHGIDILPVRSLREAIEFMNGRLVINPVAPTDGGAASQTTGGGNVGGERSNANAGEGSNEPFDVNNIEHLERASTQILDRNPDMDLHQVQERISSALQNHDAESVEFVRRNLPEGHPLVRAIREAAGITAPAPQGGNGGGAGSAENANWTEIDRVAEIMSDDLGETANIDSIKAAYENGDRTEFNGMVGRLSDNAVNEISRAVGQNSPIAEAIANIRSESQQQTNTPRQDNQQGGAASNANGANTYTDREGNSHTVEHNEGGLKATIHPSEIGAVQAELAKAFRDAGNEVDGAEEYAHALSHFLGRGNDARSPHPGMRAEGVMKHQLAEKMEARLQAKMDARNNAARDFGESSQEYQDAVKDYEATQKAVVRIAETCGITPDMLPEGTDYNRTRNALGSAPRAANPEHQGLVDALHNIGNSTENRSENGVSGLTDDMREGFGQYLSNVRDATGITETPESIVEMLNSGAADDEISAIRDGYNNPGGTLRANPALAAHLNAIRQIPREQQLEHVRRLMGQEGTSTASEGGQANGEPSNEGNAPTSSTEGVVRTDQIVPSVRDIINANTSASWGANYNPERHSYEIRTTEPITDEQYQRISSALGGGWIAVPRRDGGINIVANTNQEIEEMEAARNGQPQLNDRTTPAGENASPAELPERAQTAISIATGGSLEDAQNQSRQNARNIGGANRDAEVNGGHIHDAIAASYRLMNRAADLSQQAEEARQRGDQDEYNRLNDQAVALQNQAMALSHFASRNTGGMSARNENGELTHTGASMEDRMRTYLASAWGRAVDRHGVEGAENARGVQGAREAIRTMGGILGFTPEFNGGGVEFNWNGGNGAAPEARQGDVGTELSNEQLDALADEIASHPAAGERVDRGAIRNLLSDIANGRTNDALTSTGMSERMILDSYGRRLGLSGNPAFQTLNNIVRAREGDARGSAQPQQTASQAAQNNGSTAPVNGQQANANAGSTAAHPQNQTAQQNAEIHHPFPQTRVHYYGENNDQALRGQRYTWPVGRHGTITPEQVTPDLARSVVMNMPSGLRGYNHAYVANKALAALHDPNSLPRQIMDGLRRRYFDETGRSARNIHSRRFVQMFNALHPGWMDGFNQRIADEQRAREARVNGHRVDRMTTAAAEAAANGATSPAPEAERVNFTAEDASDAVNRIVRSVGEEHRQRVQQAMDSFRNTGRVPSEARGALAGMLPSSHPVMRAIHDAELRTMSEDERRRERARTFRPTFDEATKNSLRQIAEANGIEYNPDGEFATLGSRRMGYNCYLTALVYAMRKAGLNVPFKSRPSGYGADSQNYFIPVKQAMADAGWEPVQGATRQETVANLNRLAQTKPNGYSIECWSGGRHGTHAYLMDGKWIWSDVYNGNYGNVLDSEALAEHIGSVGRNGGEEMNERQRRVAKIAILKGLSPEKRRAMTEAQRNEYVEQRLKQGRFVAESSFGHSPDQGFSDELVKQVLRN